MVPYSYLLSFFPTKRKWTLQSTLDFFKYDVTNLICGSVQFSRWVVSDSLRPHELQHIRPPCPSPTPGVHSNSRPSSQWCHPTVSSSVKSPSPTFNLSQHQVFSNESVLLIRWPKYWSFSFSISPPNEYSVHPSGWTGLVSLQSKGLSRVFSNTTIQKHQFFSAQLSL